MQEVSDKLERDDITYATPFSLNSSFHRFIGSDLDPSLKSKTLMVNHAGQNALNVALLQMLSHKHSSN